MNVLIVDDISLNTMLIKAFLPKSYDVVCSSDGQEAIKFFTERLGGDKSFDLVFLDLMLPRFDGFNILDEIRRIEKLYGDKKAIVIIVSAVNETQIILEAFKSTADEYLLKPISRHNLYKSLSKFNLTVDEEVLS